MSDTTKPTGLPYIAYNALANQPAVTRPLLFFAGLLIALELTLFFAPKIGWLLDPQADWTSLSLLRNPLRQEVFADYAFYSLRDAAMGLKEFSTAQSLKPVAAEALQALPRGAVDVLDCAYPDRYISNIFKVYEREGCEVAYQWLVETGQYNELTPRPYTLVTSTVLHAGLIHVAFNALALAFIARLALLRMGLARFLLFFFAAGVAGFLMHAGIRGYMRGSMQPVVGASGAIMACVGLHWRIMYDRARRQSPAFWLGGLSHTAQLRKRIFAFLWADLFFIITATFVSGEAHIGGLVFGFLAGTYFLRRPAAHKAWLKRNISGPILSPPPKDPAS